jgi:translation initiation factor IF-2
MSKVRINDLAREMEVKSRQVLDVLAELGLASGKTHSSSLEEDEAAKVRAHIERGNAAKSAAHGSAAASRAPQGITPKIDLSHISKPGDVLKAIQAKKKEEEEARLGRVPRASVGTAAKAKEAPAAPAHPEPAAKAPAAAPPAATPARPAPRKIVPLPRSAPPVVVAPPVTPAIASKPPAGPVVAKAPAGAAAAHRPVVVVAPPPVAVVAKPPAATAAHATSPGKRSITWSIRQP